MSRMLMDEQVLSLETAEDLEKVLKHYEDTDRWIGVRAEDLMVSGFADYPLFYADMMQKTDASPEIFEETVKGAGLFLSVPTGRKNEVIAIRNIGLGAVYERAGLSCRLIRNIEDDRYYKALGAEKRAELLSLGFQMSTEPVKVLVSDDKISTIGSAQYAILDYRTGIEKAVAEVRKQGDFDDALFSSGAISHEGLIARYKLSGMGVDSHALMMEKACGAKPEGYYLIWSSSHTKMSSMTARMAVEVKGCLIPIGKPAKVRHKGDSKELLNDFAFQVKGLGASLKENEEQIETLGNTVVYHAKGCLTNVFKTCSSIPASAKKRVIEAFPDTPCTAFDICLAVASATENIEGTAALVQATEDAARVLFVDFKAMDKEAD